MNKGSIKTSISCSHDMKEVYVLLQCISFDSHHMVYLRTTYLFPIFWCFQTQCIHQGKTVLLNSRVFSAMIQNTIIYFCYCFVKHCNDLCLAWESGAEIDLFVPRKVLQPYNHTLYGRTCKRYHLSILRYHHQILLNNTHWYWTELVALKSANTWTGVCSTKS